MESLFAKSHWLVVEQAAHARGTSQRFLRMGLSFDGHLKLLSSCCNQDMTNNDCSHKIQEGTRLCSLDELPVVGGLERVVETEKGPLRLVLFRHEGGVVAYVNGCKHFVGTPLNPNGIGNFLHPKDSSLIRCGVHGALYRVATGACVEGECDGNGLDRVQVTINDGHVTTG